MQVHMMNTLIIMKNLTRISGTTEIQNHLQKQFVQVVMALESVLGVQDEVNIGIGMMVNWKIVQIVEAVVYVLYATAKDILDKYAEILERVASPKFAELALYVITNNPYTVFTHPFYNFHLITADPDDNKFVDCAVASNAKFIVTEDSHYNLLKSVIFPVVEIIKLDEIMPLL